MTTTVSTRSPSTLNPTRQQLDELDALLQRMLELPVNQLSEVEQDTAGDEPAQEEPADEAAPPAADLGERPPVVLSWSSAPAAVEENNPPPQPAPRPAVPLPSYMVVETASPRPLPPASGFEPRPPALTPRLVPVTLPQIGKQEPQAVEPAARMEASVPPSRETPAAAADSDAWVPLRSTWQPSAQTWQPLADSWHQAQSGVPIPEVMPRPVVSSRPDVSPSGDTSQISPEVRLGSPDQPPPVIEPASAPSAPLPAPTEPRLSLSAEDAPVAVPPAVLPLLWFNQGFDAFLAPLGAPARWLCGPRGRQLLGLAGLACLAAAVIVAVSAGMGWTW